MDWYRDPMSDLAREIERYGRPSLRHAIRWGGRPESFREDWEKTRDAHAVIVLAEKAVDPGYLAVIMIELGFEWTKLPSGQMGWMIQSHVKTSARHDRMAERIKNMIGGAPTFEDVMKGCE
jgi:hypothetical protein